MEMRSGYRFVPEKMFSGIKSDFSRVLLDFRGKYRIAMTCSILGSILERNFCDVISLKVETPIT